MTATRIRIMSWLSSLASRDHWSLPPWAHGSHNSINSIVSRAGKNWPTCGVALSPVSIDASARGSASILHRTDESFIKAAQLAVDKVIQQHPVSANVANHHWTMFSSLFHVGNGFGSGGSDVSHKQHTPSLYNGLCWPWPLFIVLCRPAFFLTQL